MVRDLHAEASDRNLLLYEDGGSIIGGLVLRETSPYITPQMLYRYCRVILRFSVGEEWAIFRLSNDGITGTVLREADRTAVAPGKYIVLNRTGGAVEAGLWVAHALDRPHSRSASSSQASQERSNLQTRFRDRLREREQHRCAIMGTRSQHWGHGGETTRMQAAHVFPISSLTTWNNNPGYRRWITDSSGPEHIGQSGLFSLQNGLLLEPSMHVSWDMWLIAVDPDEDYKVICFEEDSFMVGGRRLQESATNPVDPDNRVSDDLLRWHLNMCLAKNMTGIVGTQQWEYDLGPDDIGEIMDQVDAGERMEAELFSRLAPDLDYPSSPSTTSDVTQ